MCLLVASVLLLEHWLHESQCPLLLLSLTSSLSVFVETTTQDDMSTLKVALFKNHYYLIVVTSSSNKSVNIIRIWTRI